MKWSLEFIIAIILIIMAVLVLWESPALQCTGKGGVKEIITWSPSIDSPADGGYLEIICEDGTSYIKGD